MISPERSDVQTIVEMAEAARVSEGWSKSCQILREGLVAHPDSVLLMVRLGKALRFCSGFAEAREVLQRAEAIAPDDYEVLYQLGIVLRAEAEIWGAFAAHSSLVKKFPADPNARHVLANDHIVLGYPDKALPELKQLIGQFPSQMNYRISYADCLNKMGRYTESIAVLNEVLEQDPLWVDALISLAEANQGLRRPNQWTAAARKAYELDPDSAGVHLLMHDVCLAEANFEQALRHLQRALESHPRCFKAQVAMGSFYWNGNDEDGAREWFELANKIAPWDGQVQGMLAQFQAENEGGIPDETEGDIPKIELLENEALTVPYGGLPYYLGRIFLGTYHDYERALRFCQLAVECAPEDVDTRRLLGQTYLVREEYDAAIQQLQLVVEWCPDWIQAKEELAYAYLQADKLSEAATVYASVVPYLPDKADVHHGYGVTLVNLGQIEEGLTHLQKAVQLDTNNGNMLWSLALALEVIDRPKEALEVALKAKVLLPENDQEISELVNRLQASP
ncbi:tetratricopeptide repeat protein [Hymenobacter sp. BT664]|uniref:Tetratricopeptide repeat protein n=1 Tax=Hymenobacter montanus TaxID=2771359 RepID=A0A927BHJ8_9BACT|nr:tetratricopeptide repeat protein [Hymenobacter montanus]MBD2770385.1 tetratricopeptide repeat protein [Hymenobacter montanus]